MEKKFGPAMLFLPRQPCEEDWGESVAATRTRFTPPLLQLWWCNYKYSNLKKRSLIFGVHVDQYLNLGPYATTKTM